MLWLWLTQRPYWSRFKRVGLVLGAAAGVVTVASFVFDFSDFELRLILGFYFAGQVFVFVAGSFRE